MVFARNGLPAPSERPSLKVWSCSLTISRSVVFDNNLMMEEPSKKRRLLFLPASDGKPTSRRTRSKSLDSRIRRHLMVDIGKSRRKPSKDRQFVTLVWPLAETSRTQPSTGRGEDSTSRDDDNLQVPTKDLVAPDTTATYTAPYAMSPILYTLSTFEREWGEDSFSAYGFTLIMVAGKNAMGSGELPKSSIGSIIHPLLNLRAQLARQTPSGSPSPLENPPSFSTTNRFSPHLMFLSRYTVDHPESSGPWPWSVLSKLFSASSLGLPAPMRAARRLKASSTRYWHSFATM